MDQNEEPLSLRSVGPEASTVREKPLQLEDLEDRLTPFLSDRAKAALRRKHFGWRRDMVAAARMFAGPPSDDDLRELGHDLSSMVEVLSRPVRVADCVVDVEVDGSIAVPMMIPVSGGRCVVVLYVRVTWADQPDAWPVIKDLVASECGVHLLDRAAMPDHVGRAQARAA